ncbi:probable 2-oxoglutarate dehydrogenase E1 component DHKTD1, mitochondrial isoform X2 [Centruroides sculpturatus]|uniref:probable 2-oxoglutarate dehydrogenase E1 component DHKTD1, mitochondrial isoform X2 n=1 Tax=Centruroides sculpturatus TaxID=218467 RepID=UPI000C6CE07B|nr:probable 2-oxoglutarate dehydrogenase E1 component DHKTD1, mitochondrial isoform X2 [Centruroides sculpturatus]
MKQVNFLLNKLKLLSKNYRNYHCKQGVFGYKPYKKVSETTKNLDNVVKNCNVYRLVNAYREHGHKLAKINPIFTQEEIIIEELNSSCFGVYDSNMNNSVNVEGILFSDTKEAKISEIIDYLKRVYCGPIGIEFLYLESREERDWMAWRFEKLQNEELSKEEKDSLGLNLLKSQVFDNFLATKFSTVKRYGGEGAESIMGFYDELFSKSAEFGISDVIIGMAHRGRLNLLTGLLKYPPEAMFQKMKGMSEFPKNVTGSGDVLSHLTSSVDLEYKGKHVHVTMLPNPSHLEAVSPVVCGKARGRLLSLKCGDYLEGKDKIPVYSVLPVQVHGDASFTGQGIIMETLAMSNIPHFNVGGSIHIIINNQLGYTTPGERGRSSLYCSDIMKMIAAPVIHVNGDYPEELVKATRLALEYRQKFQKDILIDLICFRRWGHNEMDDPTYTNPIMYDHIHARQSIPDKYTQKLVDEGVWTENTASDAIANYLKDLNSKFKCVDFYEPQANHLQKKWSTCVQATNTISKWDTGVPLDVLKFVGAKSVNIPDNFIIHNHLHKVLVAERLKRIEEGTKIDWATAEALAIGSLLYQGFNVRISGQDVGRGTFSQRHAMVVEQKTNEMYVPLNNMLPNQSAFYEVANSILSEEAVLAFEYGMSIESPKHLIIWEAQFGDFFNGAQIIIDTFVSSGETKWLLQSGLVMLLPHGYDGAGPEHSSCHIERFLQNCDSKEDNVDGDDINWLVTHPTTPANYFHLLRQQMIRNFRKPLVVASPKTLLRLPAAVSSLSDMISGTTFTPVLGDNTADPNKVKRVVICSGKYFYTLHKEREDKKIEDTAIIRIEALCPFPANELSNEIKKFNKAKEFIWCQEEHRNMGPWFFVRPRFQNLLGISPTYIGRDILATAAVGIGQRHQQESVQILKKLFNS